VNNTLKRKLVNREKYLHGIIKRNVDNVIPKALQDTLGGFNNGKNTIKKTKTALTKTNLNALGTLAFKIPSITTTRRDIPR